MAGRLVQKLRSPSEGKGVGNRKKPSPFEVFLERWRSGLEKASPLWDGQRAYSELKRKKVLDFLRCEKEWKDDWRSHDCVERIWQEVLRYQEDGAVWEGTSIRKVVEAELKYLNKLHEGFKRREEKTKVPALKYQLGRLGREVDKSNRAIQEFVRLGEESKFLYSPLGGWELLWPKQKYRIFVRRAVELDTRFQIQLGKILSTYLRQHGVTLMTLCRLIVLAYWASELAAPFLETGKLRIIHTGRILRVRKVQINLIEAGLEKAEAFSSRIPKPRKGN